MPTFITFNELKGREAIIVDGRHARGLVLSHWKGANMHPEFAADTSAAVVLNALRRGHPQLALEYVSATHFDIDGFVGVWSLFNPALALAHDALLREMALIGDFREYRPENPQADTALKLVCWINAEERTRFYRPYGAAEMEQNEVTECREKFMYFLEHFAAALENPERYRGIWQEEYERVQQDCVLAADAPDALEAHPDIDLLIVRAPRPLHYYALFGPSVGYDIVLSLYPERRYELEYKYTTWVDIVSRPTLPRIGLGPLVAALNREESAGQQWHADTVSDTGPILRLEAQGLSKAERFANPYEREIFSSSIPEQDFVGLVLHYFREAYRTCSRKRFWSWNDIKSL